MSKKSAEERARERDDKAAARDAEKERKRLDKEAAKEQKARDKQRAAALAEVNKVRTDKKVSTPEMIVDLPASLPPALALQAQELLKDLSVEYKTCQTPVDNVVKWRRKVQSNYNEDLGMWEPMPLRIDDESYAMAVVTADDFVTMALAPEGEDLDAHVAKMRQHYPTEQTIYLIDGLNVWMRKNRNVRNRQFVSAVRGQEDDAPTSSTARKRKTQTPRAYIDEDMIEDALLQLQVVHGVQIHHTAAPIETAQWIAVFTQHISTVPYRKQKEAANAAGAGFCMESGQVRTGEDVRDTYTKMLQEIARVTAPIAYGIANEFGTVSELVRGLEEGGPLVLEACRKSANKDGALSDRAVGQAVSRRLHKVFTGRDETSTDV
jgi:crossover junction endonuclease EME1